MKPLTLILAAVALSLACFTLPAPKAEASGPFPLATAFLNARANVAALRVARIQAFTAPIVVQRQVIVKQQFAVQKQYAVQQYAVQKFVAPVYAAPIVQYQQAYQVQAVQAYQVQPIVQQYVAPVQVQAYVAPVQVQAVGCAAFFSY
jgi:hypothetical protein